MPQAGKEQPAHPNWRPPPIATYWDDLLDAVRTPADWEARRKAIKARFLKLIRNEAAPPAPVELDIQAEREWDGGGFTIRRISYRVEAGERAHAYLGIPAGVPPAGGFPAVLCLHGTTNWGARRTLGLLPEAGDPHGDRRNRGGLDAARLLVRHGFVTLSPEHFCCATRLPKEGPFDTAAFYRKHPDWSAVGKSTFENHVALNVLCAQPQVNARKIGVTGHSLGGHNSIFIAAYDDRVQCVVPSGAGMTINLNLDCLEVCRDHWYSYLPHLREALLKGERIQCDFHEMMALSAPRPLLEFFALNDGAAATQAHRLGLHLRLSELYRLLGREEAHSFLVFGDGHATPDLTRAALVSWMERWLKYDGHLLGGCDNQPALER